MSNSTYTTIAQYTITNSSSNISTIAFNSIPQTYTDLRINCNLPSLTTPYGLSDVAFSFNADHTTSRFSDVYFFGYGGTPASPTIPNNLSYSSSGFAYIDDPSAFAQSTDSTVTFDIYNYSNTTTNKTVFCRWYYPNHSSTNTANLYVAELIYNCNSTNAVASFELNSSNFAGTPSRYFPQGTVIDILGIKAA